MTVRDEDLRDTAVDAASDGDQDLVVKTVRAILANHPPLELSAELPWDRGLWFALAAAGMTGVGLPEEAGGSGGGIADAVAIVATLAAGAAAVPVAEQLLVAGPALVAAGLAVPALDEPLSIALSGGATMSVVDGVRTLSGTAAGVPWAAVARHLAVVARGPEGPVLAVVEPTGGLTIVHDRNLAVEPRGSVVFEAAPVSDAASLTHAQADELRARYALARAVQLAAALEQVLAWTVQYAEARLQFGRPLGKFQAIQMELAQMAGEVVAVSALVDAAVTALEDGQYVVPAAAAAKVRAGAAASAVAKLAHQVHGAIGFTQEHKLHHLTGRLWAWRDEAGSEPMWAQALAGAVLAEGPDGLWPMLTRLL